MFIYIMLRETKAKRDGSDAIRDRGGLYSARASACRDLEFQLLQDAG